MYIETPTHLGVLEERVADVATMAHDAGALLVAGVDPITLGVLAPPSTFGADITVGPMQPLGVHMNGGGGEGGFMAMRDEEQYVRQYPGLQLSMVETSVSGEHTYAHGLVEQTSYGLRTKATTGPVTPCISGRSPTRCTSPRRAPRGCGRSAS